MVWAQLRATNSSYHVISTIDFFYGSLPYLGGSMHSYQFHLSFINLLPCHVVFRLEIFFSIYLVRTLHGAHVSILSQQLWTPSWLIDQR